MELSLAVAFCSCLAPALASSMNDDSDPDSPFHYDYESLRIGGLVFAVTLFILGILLIISRKCHCQGSGQQKPVGMDPEAAGAKGGK